MTLLSVPMGILAAVMLLELRDPDRPRIDRALMVTTFATCLLIILDDLLSIPVTVFFALAVILLVAVLGLFLIRTYLRARQPTGTPFSAFE